MSSIHADVDALRGLHEALVRYRHAQREVARRGDEEIAVVRASLEAKARRWRAQLEQSRAELAACQEQAAQAAAAGPAADRPAAGGPAAGGPAVDGPAAGGAPVDCSGYARAVEQCGERLEQIRRWQQRIDAEASEFQGTASRFGDLLENDLPRTEEHLLALIRSLEAARRVQAPGS